MWPRLWTSQLPYRYLMNVLICFSVLFHIMCKCGLVIVHSNNRRDDIYKYLIYFSHHSVYFIIGGWQRCKARCHSGRKVPEMHARDLSVRVVVFRLKQITLYLPAGYIMISVYITLSRFPSAIISFAIAPIPSMP